MSKFKTPPKASQGVQEWVEGTEAPQGTIRGAGGVREAPRRKTGTVDY